MSNVTIRTCVLGVDAYYCKDMFRIRADILESREGGSIRFSEYKKVFVTCYVVKNENGREILMSRLR